MTCHKCLLPNNSYRVFRDVGLEYSGILYKANLNTTEIDVDLDTTKRGMGLSLINGIICLIMAG